MLSFSSLLLLPFLCIAVNDANVVVTVSVAVMFHVVGTDGVVFCCVFFVVMSALFDVVSVMMLLLTSFMLLLLLGRC